MATGHTRHSSKASSKLSSQFSEVSFESTQASEAPSEGEPKSTQCSEVPSDTESRSAQESGSNAEVKSETVQASDSSSEPSLSDKPKQKHVHGPQCRHASPFQDFPTWDCVHADTSCHPSYQPKPSPEPISTHEFSFELSDTYVSDGWTDRSAVGPVKDTQPFERHTATNSALEDDSDPVQKSPLSDKDSNGSG